MIVHEPLFPTEPVIEHYSKKDGVDIKYVCTSALADEARSMDIFFRETPHPKFGNRYFGIYHAPNMHPPNVFITNADKIEDVEFGLVEDDDGNLQYSTHRHDYKTFKNGNMIDGGRAYIRTFDGCRVFKIKDGEFYETITRDES